MKTPSIPDILAILLVSLFLPVPSLLLIHFSLPFIFLQPHLHLLRNPRVFSPLKTMAFPYALAFPEESQTLKPGVAHTPKDSTLPRTAQRGGRRVIGLILPQDLMGSCAG